MAKVESEEKQSLRKEWLAHEYTQEQIPALRAQLGKKLQVFLGAAALTTDAAVAHAYREFSGSYVMLAMFTKGTPEERSLADSLMGALRG